MDCVTATKDSYPFPTDVALPTHQARELDPKDPRGLSYCYHGGSYTPIDDESFWSLFSDDILNTLRNESNCKQVARAWAPLVVAMQATFLLDTTTDFIDEPETKPPTPSPSIEASSTPTGVLVDPFQVTSQAGDEQRSSQSESDTRPSLTSASASSTIPGSTKTEHASERKTTSVAKQSLEASAPPAAQSSTLSDGNESLSSESPGPKPTTSAEETSESQVVGPTPSAKDTPASSGQPAASPETSQLEILNSLIQDVGQGQSSVGLPASTSSEAPSLTLDGVTLTPDSSSGYVVGEQTLKAGEPAVTLSGTYISLASGASAIVVDSITDVLVASESSGGRGQANTPAPFLTLMANSNSASEYVVEEQTLKPGGPAITISGTPISLEQQATAVVVGSSTRPIATISYGVGQVQQSEVHVTAESTPQLTLAGTTATLNSASEYVIAGQTLKAGGSRITVSGTPISLASQATAIVVGSSTSIFGSAPHSEDKAQQTGKLASDLTVAGKTATLNSASEYVVEDQTLMPGGSAITLSGTRISLAPDATAVIIGSSTSALAAASSGIGDYVWAGIAGVMSANEDGLTASSAASETRSASVVTSTASDGKVAVETVLTAETAASSPTGLSSSLTGTSSFASGQSSSASSSSSSSSSSAESPDVASAAASTKSVAELVALVCWVRLFVLLCLQ